MTTTPDFRAELEKLVDLYKALGGDWSPHGYTDTWNDALAGARTALATPPPAPPATAIEIIDLSIEIDDAGLGIVEFARAVLERWGHG